MKTIYKYPFEIQPSFTSEIPQDHLIVLVELQQNTPCIWMEVDKNKEWDEVKTFYIFGTGHDIPDDKVHVASFQMPPFVWHLYKDK